MLPAAVCGARVIPTACVAGSRATPDSDSASSLQSVGSVARAAELAMLNTSFAVMWHPGVQEHGPLGMLHEL